MQHHEIDRKQPIRMQASGGRRYLHAMAFLPCLWLGACITDSGHGGESGHGIDVGHGDHGHSLDTISIPAALQGGAWTKDRLYARGEILFNGMCVQCHQENGVGMIGFTPPLHESDFIRADRVRPIGIVLNGLKGPIVVNGENYDSEMPAIHGSDVNVAAVLTYVRNHCNGASDSIGTSEVAAARR